jgi:hypothetical protein
VVLLRLLKLSHLCRETNSNLSRHYIYQSQNSSAGLVIRLPTGRQRNRGSVPGGGGRSDHVQIDTELPVPYSVDTTDFFAGGKAVRMSR